MRQSALFASDSERRPGTQPAWGNESVPPIDRRGLAAPRQLDRVCLTFEWRMIRQETGWTQLLRLLSQLPVNSLPLRLGV